jgi:hypothetical protein
MQRIELYISFLLLSFISLAMMGCLTTKSFQKQSINKDVEATDYIREMLATDGECMIIQKKDRNFPLWLIVRTSQEQQAASSSEAIRDILSGLPLCATVVLLSEGPFATKWEKDANGQIVLESRRMVLYASDYDILCRSKNVSEMKKGNWY